MNTEKQNKVKISITLSKELIDNLDSRTSNRSRYIDYVLRFYYAALKEDISKIKL